MNKNLILVVEDDAPVRNLITTTLKTHDYRYLTAPSGESHCGGFFSQSGHYAAGFGAAGYGWNRSHQKGADLVQYADYCNQCQK